MGERPLCAADITRMAAETLQRGLAFAQGSGCVLRRVLGGGRWCSCIGIGGMARS